MSAGFAGRGEGSGRGQVGTGKLSGTLNRKFNRVFKGTDDMYVLDPRGQSMYEGYMKYRDEEGKPVLATKADLGKTKFKLDGNDRRIPKKGFGFRGAQPELDTDIYSDRYGKVKVETQDYFGPSRTMAPSRKRKVLEGVPITPIVARTLRNAAKGQAFRSSLQRARAVGRVDPLLDDIVQDFGWVG